MVDVETASRDALIAHIDTLEARLAAYGESARAARRIALRRAFRITEKQAEILELLGDGRTHARTALFDYLYAACGDDAPVSENVLDVQLSRLRRALRPHGVMIANLWGAGWGISDGLATVRAAAAEVRS